MLFLRSKLSLYVSVASSFWLWVVVYCAVVAKLCPTLLQPCGLYTLPGSSVHGILQPRILEWVAIAFSRGSSEPRDWAHISWTGRQILQNVNNRWIGIKATWKFFVLFLQVFCKIKIFQSLAHVMKFLEFEPSVASSPPHTVLVELPSDPNSCLLKPGPNRASWPDASGRREPRCLRAVFLQLWTRAQIPQRWCYNAESPSVDPRCSWSICASNKFPDEADPAGPWIRVPKARP